MKKIALLLITPILLLACDKDEGKFEIQGEETNTKTFNFSLTYEPGDTYREYSGITGFDEGDMVITYVLNNVYDNDPYYVQLPYVMGNVYFTPQVSETNGNLFIDVEYADGSSGSPINISTTLDFKAILIKSSALIEHPNTDFSNYKKVKETFNIAE